MALTSGANPEALDSLAKTIDAGATCLDEIYLPVRHALQASTWNGPDADAFASEWDGPAKTRIVNVATQLRSAAKSLRMNAQQQRNASADGGGGSTTPRGTHSAITSVSPIDSKKIDLGLGTLGLPKDAVDMLNQMIEKMPISKLEEIKQLAAFIADHPNFIKAMKYLGTAATVAATIVSFARDFIDHPSLPTDDRLVHATTAGIISAAETGAISAGVSKLGAAIGTAIGGPAGTVAGFVIGEGVGIGAQFGLSEADSHFHISEKMADQMVGRYEFRKHAVLDTYNGADNLVHGHFGEGLKDLGKGVGAGAVILSPLSIFY